MALDILADVHGENYIFQNGKHIAKQPKARLKCIWICSNMQSHKGIAYKNQRKIDNDIKQKSAKYQTSHPKNAIKLLESKRK